MLLFALLLASAQPAATPDQVAMLTTLRDYDARLNGIAWRLATANRALCRDLAPTPGWTLHAQNQYDASMQAAARTVFGFDLPVAVEVVAPGSPATAAGIMAGDSVSAVNGSPFAPATAGKASSATRDAVAAQIARQPADAPLAVALNRGGKQRSVTIAASPGCRAVFEVLVGENLKADSTEREVQVGAGFFERFPDDAIAAVVAHELAHVILRHTARREAAGLQWGVFAEFGRNGRLFRVSETEADRLSVSLLYNAGYDPQIAVRFWQAHGDEVSGGLFRSRTHPAVSVRIAALEQEIAAIPSGAPRPYLPPVLAMRDQPLQ